MSLVEQIISNANVKFCVASRPWTVFEAAFEDVPMLRIEDLTRQDIETYISGNFGTCTRFVELRAVAGADAEELISRIANKAAGVFLWVYLVVASLLNGLRDGDDIRRLFQRLDDLPEELEELFDRIFNQLDSKYTSEASEFFKFLRA